MVKNSYPVRRALVLPAGMIIAIGPLSIRPAQAGEPMLNYSFTTDLLPKNRMEFDQWLTLRTQSSKGLFTFYATHDEVQYGLTSALQLGAFINTEYVNIFHNGTDGATQPPKVFPVTADPDARFYRWKFDSVGVDAIYRFRSPYTDPFGAGVYFSPLIGPGIRRLETRLILQKNFIDDRLICNFNAVDAYNYRQTLQKDSTGNATPAPPRLAWGAQTDTFLIFGVSYRFASNWSAGLEFQNVREFNGGWTWLTNSDRKLSTYYMGPTVHYGGEKFYLTLTWLPQLPWATGYTDAERANIVNGLAYSSDFERQQFRLKAGFYFNPPFQAKNRTRRSAEAPADTDMARSNIPPPPLEIYFSPEAKIQAKIIKRINATESSIDLALYSFTSSELAQALVRAHRRGVKVRAVRDSVQTGAIDDKGSYLKQHGIPMRKLAGTGQGGEMHNQFAVFDRKEVLTGSYSWTHKGDKSNVEDALLTQESAIVQAYKKEFKRLWKAPRKPAARKKAPKRTSELASN